MNAYDFEKEFRVIDKEYPTRPSWSYPAEHKTYDEDKSVKWNREKALEEQKEWIEQKRQLELARKNAQKEVESRLLDYIQDQIDISRAAAERMWNRADWDFNRLESLIDDYSYIKEVDN